MADFISPERLDQLLQALGACRDPRDLASEVLQQVQMLFDSDGAGLYVCHQGHLLPHLLDGRACPPAGFVGPEVEQFIRGQVVFHPEGLLVPMAWRGRPRMGLWLSLEQPAAQVASVCSIARLLGLTWERLQTHALLSSLLNMQQNLLSRAPDALYQPLLEEAVRLVPGAESGSLQIRQEERFHYRALVGYTWEDLGNVTFGVEESRDIWYGIGQHNWEQGVPRIISHQHAREHLITHQREGVEQVGPLQTWNVIQATLTVPILYAGEVYGLMNLDSFTDSLAFSEDSIEATRAFCVQAAILLHQARQREQVEQAALTDALTGLQNRRAFNGALEQLLSQVKRHGHLLSLLVIDLQGFKAINDQQGHHAGDQALIEVGDVLLESVRKGDQVFRWGGDEFAVLLPHTDRKGAWQVARRFSETLARVQVGGMPLRASVGIAWAEQPCSPDDLLHQADAAMYFAKRHGLSIADGVMFSPAVPQNPQGS